MPYSHIIKFIAYLNNFNVNDHYVRNSYEFIYFIIVVKYTSSMWILHHILFIYFLCLQKQILKSISSTLSFWHYVMYHELFSPASAIIILFQQAKLLNVTHNIIINFQFVLYHIITHYISYHLPHEQNSCTNLVLI